MPPFYAEALTGAKQPDRRNEDLSADFIAIAAKMDRLCPHRPSDKPMHQHETASATYPNASRDGLFTKAWVIRKDFGRDVDQKPSYVMFQLRVQAIRDGQPAGEAYDIFTTDTWGAHKVGIEFMNVTGAEKQQFIAKTNDTLDLIANAKEALEESEGPMSP
jgi:hypothetical protein